MPLYSTYFSVEVATVEGAGNDEWSTGFVDEDGVDFVNDGKVVTALDLLTGGRGHAVVAQVVETKFGVGAVGDVASVVVATFGRRLGILDAADGESEVAVKRAHPLGVPFGEVVVNGDDVDTHAGEGVEIDRKGGDEGFTFTGLHLGDDAAMEAGATDELNVEVDHLPQDILVGDVDVLAAHATGSVFDDGKGFGKNFLEIFFAEFGELVFDVAKGFFRFFDGGRRGGDSGEAGEVGAKGLDAGRDDGG